jgi:hypothetical protein
MRWFALLAQKHASFEQIRLGLYLSIGSNRQAAHARLGHRAVCLPRDQSSHR